MLFKQVKKQMSEDGKTEHDVLIVTMEDDVVCFVPKNKDNRYYTEIMRQVEAGTLTIKDAE